MPPHIVSRVRAGAKNLWKDGIFVSGVVASIVWLIAAVLILYTRYSEWSPLFGDDAKHLPLNAIGDTLAGFFAPLAFLWLFIATWLQRQELGLQRKELADTRAVLDAQMAEMRRAADASSQQAAIMQNTLAATLSQATYNEFNLELYFLAQDFVSSEGKQIGWKDRHEKIGETVFYNISNPVLQNDATSIDQCFWQIYNEIEMLVTRAQRGQELFIVEHSRTEVEYVFGYCKKNLANLIDKAEKGANSLVLSRTRGLSLRGLNANLEFLSYRVKNKAPE